jgi:membrane protease YdiL (CAAX protease family)
MMPSRSIPDRLQRALFGPGGLNLSGRILHSEGAWPLGAVILVFLAGEILPSLLLAVIDSSTRVAVPLGVMILVQPLAVLLIVWLANPFRNRPPVRILPVDVRWRQLVTYALIWGIFLRLISVAVVMIQMLVGVWAEVTNNPLLLTEHPLSAFQQALVVLSAVLLVPAAEEVFYRGILYHALGRYFGLAGAAVISTTVWTLLHGSIVLFPAIFVLGILLVLLYESTESIWPPIAAHVGFNLTSFVLLWLLPGLA